MRPAWGYNYNTGAWDLYDKSPEEIEEMKKENEKKKLDSEKRTIVLMIILGFAGIIIINFMTRWRGDRLLEYFMFICLASLVIGLLRLILQNKLFLKEQ